MQESTRTSLARAVWLPLLTVVAVPLLVFWRTHAFSFVAWDDDANLYLNPLMNPVTGAHIAAMWERPYYAAYIPVTRTLWAALAALFPGSAGPTSLSPTAYHIANIAVHTANVLLVFSFLRRLRIASWPAAAGALLFAVHPLQVEAVAWATGMKDLLGGLFSLLCIRAYLEYAAPDGEITAPSRRGRAYYGVALACYALALLSKSSAATLPLILWAADRWLLGRPARLGAAAVSWWLLLALPVTLWTHAAEHATGIRTMIPIWARPIVGTDAIAFYVGKLLWPWPLGPDYGRTPAYVVAHPVGWALCLVPIAIGWLTWRQRFDRPELTAAAAVFGAALLPVCGLAPFVFQAFSTVADRYAYLALLGPAIALAWSLNRFRTRAWRFAAAAAMAAWASLSGVQVGAWSDTTALFGQALRVNPRSWVAANNLGSELARRGDLAGAERHYRFALAVNPTYEVALDNLGLVLEKEGRTSEAETAFEAATRATPAYAQGHFGLGRMLEARGQIAPAADQFAIAARLDPDDALARSNLGACRWQLGQRAEAIDLQEQAVRIDLACADARYNLGVFLLESGRPAEAAPQLRECLRLDPGRSVAQRALADAEARLGQTARR